MTSIITGDIINSRVLEPKEWLETLKAVFNRYGKEPKHWEIYRGDSFQLEVTPEEALETAILIKATIKQFKTIDTRIAIGYGEKNYVSEKITESNGSAFINSGECFEALKKTTLAIKSGKVSFDNTLNIMLELALLTMDNWTPTASTIVKATIEYPDYNQQQLAGLLNKSQSNISEGLKRAGYDEIKKMLHYYQTQIQDLC
ncbi:transcriptional regulator [Mangrovimonas aestuarii]|uniref:transcriptional regulator n=1 Tax=Mangrovimonas aestuarii TaxID=3018443 RepID=UPI0023791A97|nr:transcriptional regulator [Mangrovimonas aestuarii]